MIAGHVTACDIQSIKPVKKCPGGALLFSAGIFLIYYDSISSRVQCCRR